MINETFMRLDDWSLQLDPSTPLSVRKECQEFDQIVITESRIDGDLDRDTVTQTALFRGPILQRSDKMTSLSGAGMEWFIGNAAGFGPEVTWVFAANRTWAQWMTRISTLSGFGGLTRPAGIDMPATTYPDAGATDDGFTGQRGTTREILNALAGYFEVEWDITPDGALRFVGAGSGNYWVGGQNGTAPTMTTPLLILMRGQEGRDIDLIGLEVVDIDAEEDSTRAAQFVSVYGTAVVATSNTGTSIPAADGATDSEHTAILTASVDTLNDATTAADAASGDYGLRSLYRATVRDWYPGRWVKPGDYVWAFDDICDIYASTATGILYRGEFVAADTLRCYGMRWAFREGMGCYRLSRYDPAVFETTRTEVIDITDYVLPEDGDCELVIGSPEQSVADILGLS